MLGGHGFTLKCKVDKNYGNFKTKSIVLDSLLIEFNANVTHTLQTPGKDYFPWHRIIATGKISN